MTKIRRHIIKKGRNAGRKMAVFVLEDLQGQVEVILFPDVLEKYSDNLVADKIVFVKGKTNCEKERLNVFTNELIALENAGEKLEALWR